MGLTPAHHTWFQVACQTIEFGRGVCGKAADSGETQLVQVGRIQSIVAVMILTGNSCFSATQDVHSFPGHIACDGETKSEIVVPIKVGEKAR